MGDNVEERRGRGRPMDPDAFRDTIRVRIGEDDLRKLQAIEKATGDNRSDIFRIALHGYYIYLLEAGRIDE